MLWKIIRKTVFTISMLPIAMLALATILFFFLLEKIFSKLFEPELDEFIENLRS